ncbi:MAG: sensor histidine kinase, partial [Thermoplasmatota archaeon]
VLNQDFQEVEQSNAEARLDVLEAQLEADLLQMRATVTEFTQIAQILIAAPNATDTSQLTIDLVNANQVSAFAFVVDGFVLGQEVNLTTGELFNSTLPIFSLLANSSLSDFDPFGTPKAHFMKGDAAYIVGAKSLGIGNQTAVLVVLREMDAAYFSQLASRAGLAGVWENGEQAGVHLEGDVLAGYVPLYGPDGESHGTIRVEMSREITEGGWQSIFFLLGCITLISLAFVFVSAIFVKKYVLNRISIAKRDMESRTRQRDWGRRMDLGGDDEIQGMAVQFNALMDELHRQETALQEAHDGLERYARVLSHDLRSPLSTLNLNLHLLSLRDDGEEIPRMQRTVKRIDEQILRILEEARASSRESTDANAALEGVLEDLSAEIAAHKAIVSSEPLPTVGLGLSPLRSVLQNLIGNSIKAGVRKAPVTVSVDGGVHDGGAFIRIQDNGRGMDSETLERVKKEFEGEGYGIGLATCYRIMAKVGRLEMESTPGVGTTATLWFDA